MARVGLDISLEVCSWDVGETLLNGGGDGWEGGVAGGEAVAAAEGEIVCCGWLLATKARYSGVP